MRPAEFAPETIIEAGQQLQAAGRNITGFALRQRVGGGNPTRLKQVWDEYLASQSMTRVEPVAELPVEVADELVALSKALTERLASLAVELNDKAVKAAERRVAEVIRTAGEQREQAERELADASQTVENLEAALDTSRGEVDALTTKFNNSQAYSQAQAVELAQLRERLAAAEQGAKAAAAQHAAELSRANEAAEHLRVELDTLRKTAAMELDQVRLELAGVKARAESDLRHAHEETRSHQLASEQVSGLLSQVREELSQARHQAAEAREEVARLQGQVDAIEGLRAELVRTLANASRPTSEPSENER
ncbi:DNA-binding protein [Malikia granosa]|uniref:Kfra protein n=1 Tax=Malikia granosa TaxID=263067 RepID=A0A2S9K099_9BURK|nr:DNA-binding protein [Malikia granosa]PRD63871.1 kfra protein [Malikia granosa]